MDKNSLTPAQIARRKYEERNRDERKQANAQFSTFIPRKIYDDINAFLESNKLTKVALIMAGYETLQQQLQKKN